MKHELLKRAKSPYDDAALSGDTLAVLFAVAYATCVSLILALTI